MSTPKLVVVVGCMIAAAAPVLPGSSSAAQTASSGTQTSRPPQNAAEATSVERGRYIVEGVALCWNCHTPRTESGELDRRRWLLGGPVVFLPAMPTPNWAPVEPRLAGLPPGTDEQFITLLMTGIGRTGTPPRPPMPRFHMTRGDAASVLAYLKSLRPE